MKKIIVVCLGLLLAATALHAAPPFQVKFSTEFSTSISCDVFDLVVDWDLKGRYTEFFDNDGTTVKGRVHYQGDVEIYREGYPENVVFGRRNEVQHGAYENGIFTGFTLSGGLIKVNLPGYGHLFFDAGRLYFDADFNITLFRGANHDFYLEEDNVICEYFE